MFDTFGNKLERIEDMFTIVKGDFEDYRDIIVNCGNLIENSLEYLFRNFHKTLSIPEGHYTFFDYERANIELLTPNIIIETYSQLYVKLRDKFDGHEWLKNNIVAYLKKGDALRKKYLHADEVDDYEIDADDMLYFTRKIVYGIGYQEEIIEPLGFDIKEYLVFSTIKNQYNLSNYKEVIHDSYIILPTLINVFIDSIYHKLRIEEKEILLTILSKKKHEPKTFIKEFLSPLDQVDLHSLTGFQADKFLNTIKKMQYRNSEQESKLLKSQAINLITILDILFEYLKNKKYNTLLDYILAIKNTYLNSNYNLELNERIQLKKIAKELKLSQQHSDRFLNIVKEIIDNNKSTFQTFQEISDLPTELITRKKVANLFSYARMKLNDRKYEAAIEDFNEILDITQNEAFYFVFRAVTYELLGKIELADKDYNKALDINKSKDFYYYNRGLAKSQACDYKGAITEFDKAIEADKGKDADFFYYRGRAKESLSLYDEALQDYNKAEKLNPKHSGIKHSKIKVNEKKYEDDNRILNSRMITNLFKYACAKLRDHDFKRAIEDLDKIIEITNERAFYFIYRGIAKEYLELDSSEDYERSLNINPKKDFFYYNKGLAKHEALDYINAINEFDIAIKLSPFEATYYYQRGLSKEKANLINEAVQDYGKVLEFQPNHSEAPRNLEKITRGKDQFKEEVVNSMNLVHLFSFTISKFEDNAYVEAISDLDRFIKIKPNIAFYYIYRGVAKELMGMKKDAGKDFSIAKKINSKQDFFYYNYGLAYFRAGKFAEAISAIDKAINCNKGSFNYHFYNGLINEKSRKYEKAITYYKFAIELNPNHKEAMGRMNKLIKKIEGNKKKLKSEEILYREQLLRNTKSHEFFENARYSLNIKEYENTIIELNKAIQLQNKIPFYHIYRGVTYQKIDNIEAMEQDFDTAIRLNPDKAMFHFNKSKAEFDIGNFKIAFQEIDKAINIQERFVFYNYRMRLYQQLGKLEQALNDSKKAKELEESEGLFSKNQF